MKRIAFVLLIVLITIGSLGARPSGVAVGAQLGFAASGVVVDVGLGSLSINAGLNYPLGITYIAAVLEEDDVFVDVFSFTADISQSFALSDNFDIKVGVGTTAFTNFGPVVLGLAGPVLKGEYWVPNDNFGLFLQLNVPLLAFGFIEGNDEFDGGIVYNPILPLLGLFTSTVGVLYSF